MPAFRICAIILFVTLLAPSMMGQEQASYLEISREAVSRMDSTNDLLNGVFYENIYYDATGDPFLFGGIFSGGSVVFRSSFIEPVSLRYDIYTQQLNVKPNPLDELILVLPGELVVEFRMGSRNFVRIKGDDAPQEYMESISLTRDLQLLKAWYKRRFDDFNNGDRLNYKFSVPLYQMYLEYKGELRAFKSNRGFVRAFPSEYQKEIRSLLQPYGKLKKGLDPDQWSQLLHLCQETLEDHQSE